MQVMEQELLAVMAEMFQCLDTRSSPSACQAEPRSLPVESPACPWAAWDTLLRLGGPIPICRVLLHGSSWDIKCRCCRRNASGRILGNWFDFSVWCWRQDGGGWRSSLSKGI